MRVRSSELGIVVSSVLLAAAACGDPYSASSGVDAGGSSIPASCDLTERITESPTSVDDSVGVFVSPNGDDGAGGSKAAPVETIGKGIALASARGLPRVYVCEGTYGTAVEIKSPIAIYGGLSCDWAYSGNKPKLAPSSGIALRVSAVDELVSMEDFEVYGTADLSMPGTSAIAVFVTSSAAVKFSNVVFSASAGAAGATGYCVQTTRVRQRRPADRRAARPLVKARHAFVSTARSPSEEMGPTRAAPVFRADLRPRPSASRMSVARAPACALAASSARTAWRARPAPHRRARARSRATGGPER